MEQKNGEKKVLEEASMAMALVDAIPVVLFCVSMLIVSSLFAFKVFLIGALISTLGGVGKVLWKIILATSKKDIRFFYKQFHFSMPAGFTLILLSLVINWKHLSFVQIWKWLSLFPANIFFVLGFIFFIAMIVAGVKMDMSTKKGNWTEQIINSLAQLNILIGVLIIFMTIK